MKLVVCLPVGGFFHLRRKWIWAEKLGNHTDSSLRKKLKKEEVKARVKGQS